MSELDFKFTLGILVIFANFASLAVLFVMYFMGGFTFEEMTTSVALIIPMFSVYTSAIVRFLYESRYATRVRGRRLSLPFVGITLMSVALFTIYLSGIIVAKAYNFGFGSFDNFKIMLAMSEAVFGVYLGYLLTSIFPSKDGALRAARGRRSKSDGNAKEDDV